MSISLGKLEELVTEIRACTICADLPLGPKPIFQFNSKAKILIVGQAPGRITHEKGIPFNDPSGVRLRDWLGLSADQFYNPDIVAIVPMGFCYPGTSKAGDLPPRDECAQAWRAKILNTLQSIELTVIIGRYALDWHLPHVKKKTVTQAVQNWQEYWPEKIVLPHPSPRNNRWLRSNPWFVEDVIPALRSQIQRVLLNDQGT